jgi:uncharacterized protein (TIGR02147 family)
MHLSFVDFLKLELKKKQENNSSYSMRGFAKYLGMDSGSLSAILNRKIPLTIKRFDRLVTKFKLAERQIQQYREEILQSSSSPVAFKMLKEDGAIALSKAHYSIILHLFDLSSFKSDVEWIANRVGITIDECSEALHRLESLKLIELQENGNYIKIVDNISFLNGRTPESGKALKELMREYFDLAFRGIDEALDSERLHSGTIFSIKKSELPGIIEHLRNTRVKILSSQNKIKKKDEVYLLSISMVPMLNSKEL